MGGANDASTSIAGGLCQSGYAANGYIQNPPLNLPTPNYFAGNGVFPVSTLIIFPSFTKRTSITAFLPVGPSSIE